MRTQLRSRMMHINEAVEECFRRSFEGNWWADLTPENEKYVIGTKMVLIHSEISEAMEGYRKDSMDDHLPHRKAVEVELADALIRIFDLSGALGLDLEGAMVEKMAYNSVRDDHKTEKRAETGGKKF